MNSFFKGEDIRIQLELTDSHGASININNLDDLVLLFYQENAYSATFTLDDTDDYNDLIVVDAEKGVVDAQLDRSITKEFSPGALRVEIKIIRQEQNWKDDQRHSIGGCGKEIAKVKESQISDEKK